MKCDVVLAGVGGQGVLAIGELLARAARREGLFVKQGEVHGMAQRGGSVQAFLRLADRPVASELVPLGSAELVVGTELLEALRCLPYLGPHGALVAAITRIGELPGAPDEAAIRRRLGSLPSHLLVDATELARQAGLPRAVNVVLAGALVHLLPIGREALREEVRRAFLAKGERVVSANLLAFDLGQEAAACVPA